MTVIVRVGARAVGFGCCNCYFALVEFPFDSYGRQRRCMADGDGGEGVKQEDCGHNDSGSFMAHCRLSLSVGTSHGPRKRTRLRGEPQQPALFGSGVAGWAA